MSALAKFLASLQAPVLVPSSEYDGLEYRWRFLVFRPALFKLDALLVIFSVFYVAYVFIGGGLNKSRAESLLNALRPVYETQFSRPVDRNRLVEDGSSDFFVFSTGRRAVKSLLTVFTMTPRHDLLQLIYQFGWTQYDLKYNPEDRVQFDFLLDEAASASVPGLVWAVVAKTELSSIKDSRWDLTLTKTTENAVLPSHMSVMSEIADVTETLLKPSGSFSLVKLLSDPAIEPYFRSLSITDQPSFRPPAPLKPESRKKYVVLTLAVPPPSAASTVIPLVQGVFQFVDLISGFVPGGKSVLSTLRPETRTKLRKRREELDAELQADAERDAKEQEAEARENALAAKRQAEKERIAALPAAEQQKALERERKKNLRKTQGKMVKK